MALEFEYILAGEGVGIGEEKTNPFIDQLAVVVEEGTVVGVPGFWFKAQN